MARVLMIEDNEANRYLVRFILEKAGHEVMEAESGEDGIEMVKKDRPDVILMDIQLPGKDGYETTIKIREGELNGDIPIVALTSYALTGDKEKALEAGCNGYIKKPIDPETFLEELEKHLK